MNFREAQMIHEGLRGPFGKWLMEQLKLRADEARLTGAQLIPENLKDEYDRDNFLNKSNVLKELAEQIPYEVDRLMQESKLTSNE